MLALIITETNLIKIQSHNKQKHIFGNKDQSKRSKIRHKSSKMMICDTT